MSAKSYEDVDSDKPGSTKVDSKKARPSPLPGKLDPARGKTSTKPDFVTRQKFRAQKGGTISKDDAALVKDLTRAREEYQQEKGPSDTLLPPKGQRPTTGEDFPNPEYDYGDKLPKNRGVPIPMERPLDNPPKTTSAKPDKHSYKVRWS